MVEESFPLASDLLPHFSELYLVVLFILQPLPSVFTNPPVTHVVVVLRSDFSRRDFLISRQKLVKLKRASASGLLS